MASNWNNPTNATLYTSVLAELKARDDDLARGFDPALTADPSNLITDAIRWNSVAKKHQKFNGTVWADLTDKYAINISGSANTLDSILPTNLGGTGSDTAAGARSNLGLAIGTDIPSKDGTGASGTWAISITGSAASASTAASATDATNASKVFVTNSTDTSGILRLVFSTNAGTNVDLYERDLSYNIGTNSFSLPSNSNIAFGNGFKLFSDASTKSVYLSNSIPAVNGVSTIAIGENAGQSVATGTQGCIYIGSSSGRYQSGSSNTAYGSFTLRYGNAGDNTAVGASALGNSTTIGAGGTLETNAMTGNSAFGRSSGSKLSDGSYNTFIGMNSGQLATTGNNNSFLGYNSGSAITTGGYNSILGCFTGYKPSVLDIRTTDGYIVLSDGGSSSSSANPRMWCDNSGIWLSPGEIRSKSNITAYYTSDIRYKTNIEVIPNALDKVLSLRGVYHDWTDDFIKSRGGEDGYFVRKHDVSVIADDVEKVLPEVVAINDDGYKVVKYEKMIPLLIEAIKELKLELNQLKSV